MFMAVGCILAGTMIEGTHLGALLDFPAFLIVIGSAFSATCVQFPMGLVFGAFGKLLWLIAPPKSDLVAQAEFLVSLASVARQQGLLALENSVASATEDFTRGGIQMIVDGVDKETLAALLQNAIDMEQEKLEPYPKVFEAFGGYCPTMGIIGAVLGLIHAMSLLDRPDMLGPAIAVAFVATIYGLVAANIIALPTGNRVKSIMAEQAVYKYMTLEGLVSIASSENTTMLKRRLAIYTGVTEEGGA